MRWVAISGSWRYEFPQLEEDVRRTVFDTVQQGCGIVTGGALGVDFIAAEEALKHNPTAEQIKIIIPTPLDIYAAHYRKRAEEGVITSAKAEALVELLTRVVKLRSGALVELNFKEVNEESYYARNARVLAASSVLHAFQVNGSKGTQDTIDKARAKGMPLSLRQYTLSALA